MPTDPKDALELAKEWVGGGNERHDPASTFARALISLSAKLEEVPTGEHWNAIIAAAANTPDAVALIHVITSDYIRMRTKLERARKAPEEADHAKDCQSRDAMRSFHNSLPRCDKPLSMDCNCFKSALDGYRAIGTGENEVTKKSARISVKTQAAVCASAAMSNIAILVHPDFHKVIKNYLEKAFKVGYSQGKKISQ